MEEELKNQARLIWQKLLEANNILFIAHQRPDGDASSSLCLMAGVAKALGKKFTAVCADPLPAQFSFLANFSQIKSGFAEIKLADFDLIMTLDCSDLQRTAYPDLFLRAPEQCLIEIDHHPNLNPQSNWQLRSSIFASTTEALHFLLVENNYPLEAKAGTAILAGIIDDTGAFLYPSTSPRTLTVAGQMIDLGANLQKILAHTASGQSNSALKLLGTAMARLKINRTYNVAISYLLPADLAGLDNDDTNGISGRLSNLPGVRAILLLTDNGQGVIKGSWRSREDGADVSALAKAMGGGGHVRAAGFTIYGRLAEEKGKLKLTRLCPPETLSVALQAGA